MKLPWAWHAQKPRRISKDEVHILVSEPRLLIVSIETHGCNCIPVAAHGPLSTSTDATIAAFCNHARELVTKHGCGRHVVLLADADATAAIPCEGHIGRWLDKKGNDASEELSNYLHDTDMWVPATYLDC